MHAAIAQRGRRYNGSRKLACKFMRIRKPVASPRRPRACRPASLRHICRETPTYPTEIAIVPTAPPDVFDALAHPLRRRLLMELRTGARFASELAADMPVGRPAVAEHMQVLRRAGLVRVERRGRQRLHHLDPRPLTEIGGWLNLMLAHWAQRIEDLKNFEADEISSR